MNGLLDDTFPSPSLVSRSYPLNKTFPNPGSDLCIPGYQAISIPYSAVWLPYQADTLCGVPDLFFLILRPMGVSGEISLLYGKKARELAW